MPEFKLKDRDGKEQTYNRDVITVPGTNGEKVKFIFPNFAELEITENGEYSVSEGVDGYTKVKANVPVPTLLENMEVPLDFSNGDMLVEVPDGYAVKSAIIKQPETLVSENIAKDVEVAGIIGTHEGGASDTIKSKAINFYDPFGDLLYSYTRAEAAKLTELPAGPELEGFVFNGWTHTLENVQSEKFFLDVAPTYARTDGTPVTILIVDIGAECVNKPVYLAAYCTDSSTAYTIDWGDGSTNAVAGSSSTTTKTTSHTYSTTGIKYISVHRSAGSAAIYLGSSWVSGWQNCFSKDSATIGTTTDNFKYDTALLSVLCDGSIYPFVFVGNLNLKFIGCGATNTTRLETKIYHCPKLETIVYIDRLGNSMSTNTQYQFYCCSSLKRLKTSVHYSKSIYDFEHTHALNDIYMGALWDTTAVPLLRVMNYKRRMIINSLTPASLGTYVTAPVFGTEPIYVPDEAVETYKTSEVFSVVADCIKPISEYPDF